MPTFAFLDPSPLLIPILIPLGAFFMICVIVISAGYFRNQRRRLWHETARLALEKGQPIPLEEFAGRICERRGPRSALRELRAGLILIAVAIGFYFGLNGCNHHLPMFVVYIPLFVGVAMLINALITAVATRKADGADRHPDKPQA